MPSPGPSPEGKGPAQKKSGFFSDVRAVSIARVATIAISFGTSVLLARALGPSDRGLLAAIVLIPTLVASVFESGVRQSTAFHIAKETFPEQQILAGLVSIFILISGIGFLACLVALMSFRFNDVPLSTFLLVSSLVPLFLLRSFSSGVFLGKGQIVKFNGTFWVPELIRFALIAIFALGVGLSVVLAVGAQIAALMMIVLYGLLLIHRMVGFRLTFSKSAISVLAKTGFGFGLSLFLIVLNYKIGTLILHQYSTSAEVGYFAVALTLAELLWQLPTVLNSLLFQRSAKTKARGAFSVQVLALMRLTVFAASGLAVIAVAIAPIFVPLVFGEAFTPSVLPMAVLLPGIVVMCVFKILASEIGGAGRPMLSIIATVPCVLVNVALGYLLVPSLGAVGAALATSFAYLTCSVIYCAIYMRITGTKLSQLAVPRRADFDLLFSKIPALSGRFADRFKNNR